MDGDRATGIEIEGCTNELLLDGTLRIWEPRGKKKRSVRKREYR